MAVVQNGRRARVKSGNPAAEGVDVNARVNGG